MKRILIAVFAATMAFAAIGCGGGDEAADTSQVVDQSEAPPMDGGVSAEPAAPATQETTE